MITDYIRFNRVIFRGREFTADYFGPAVDACARYLDANVRSNSADGDIAEVVR